MEYTTNLNLKKPEQDDFYNIENENDNMDKIDTEIVKKADKTEVLTKTNTTAFAPTGDYNPATKKYVDDKVSNINVPIVDNLTSTSTTSALSANQGKVLNDKVTALPIKSLAGQTVKGIGSTTFTAGDGATIIGDLRERTYIGVEPEMGNIATGEYSVAMGSCASATGDYAVAMGAKGGGWASTASGRASFVMGSGSRAKGTYSIAMGQLNDASGLLSVAMGKGNEALDHQFKIGRYAKSGTAGGSNSIDGDAFIIGNSVVDANPTSSQRSNAFRVTFAGKAYGLSAYGSSGADYAEYFEWSDGNPDNEDRRGRLVTLDGEKIRFATADDDYILGIISANPCVEGDIQPDDWQGKYLTDVFGQRLTKTVHIPDRYEEHETIDPETGETKTERILIEKEHDAVQWVLNPDYDPEQEYVSREDRKEWAPVGMMGKLVVVDDGTCEVNGFCKAGENGIATKANDGYRVMARIDDTHLRVLVK